MRRGSRPGCLLAVFVAVSAISSSTAARTPLPNLFTELDAVSAASAEVASLKLPGDLDIVTTSPGATTGDGASAASAGSGSQPVVSVVGINKQVLRTITPTTKMKLTLPGKGKPVTILGSTIQLASAAGGEVAAAAADAPANLTIGSVWVGEVEGAPGGLSAVTLTVGESGAVYGNIRFVDPKSKRLVAYRITPVIIDKADPAAAAGAQPGMDPAQLAALYPQIDTERHMVIQYKEPNRPRLVMEAPEGLPAVNTASLPSSDLVVTNPAFPAWNTTALEDIPAQAATASTPIAAATAPGGRKLQQTAMTYQDLLIVYTVAAASRAGGDEAMRQQARFAVAITNKAYIDSGINVQVNLLDIRRLPTYNEANVLSVPGRKVVDDMAEGKVPDLWTWRDQLGADLVSVFNDNTYACGAGWFFYNSVNYAATEVNRGCWNGYTLAHELGHNAGCHHDATDNLQSGMAGNFARGHRRCDLGKRNFKTIMSYGCDGAQEVGLYSTPARNVYPGIPAGNANIADCSRGIRQTAVAIANYRSNNVFKPSGVSDSTLRPAMAPNLCLDAPNWNSGTQVLLWDCHNGVNQRFEYLSDSSLRWPGTNKCLEVKTTLTGTVEGGQNDFVPVQVGNCNTMMSQKWSQDAFGRLRPLAAPQKCLDVPFAEAVRGRTLYLYDCGDDKNPTQVFIAPVILQFKPKTSEIRTRHNDLCLAVFQSKTSNGAQVGTWPCLGITDQQWTMDSWGRLRIAGLDWNKCLDVSACCGYNNQSPVIIYDCHNGNNQRFFVDGEGRLRSFAAPDKCVDMRGVSGSAAQLWDCASAPQQRWYVPV